MISQLYNNIIYVFTLKKHEHLVKSSDFFDSVWYQNEYGVSDNPVKHYLTIGWKKGYNPSQNFNGQTYLDCYPDVAGNNINPLVHYLLYGINEGRGKDGPPPSSVKKSFSAVETLRDISDRVDLLPHKFKNIAVIIAELSIMQCCKYRVEQTAFLYREFGYLTKICSWQDFPRCISYLQHAKIVIFYRVPFSNSYLIYLDECQRHGISYYYDIDDPMFDINALNGNSNLDYIPVDRKNRIIESAELYLSAINKCDLTVVSTPGIATSLKRSGYQKNVIVRKNAVDEEMQIFSEYTHREHVLPKNSDTISMMYATPSLAHNADFEMIFPQIHKILSYYNGKVRLQLMGEKLLPEGFEDIAKFVDIKSVGAYRQYLETIALSDIFLVPLQDSFFNQCKSNIKFLDASMVRVPCVCSPVGDYSLLQNGTDCMLAETEDEWHMKLNYLIENVERRFAIGNNGYLTATSEFLLNGKILQTYHSDLLKAGIVL